MPEYTPNGLLFKQIHDRLEKQANNALRAKDLTMMQVSVLMALQKAAGQRLSMKALERYFGVAQSTVAGIVSRLEQKGLVEAFGDAADKRIKLVHITPAGEQCCTEASFRMDEAEENLLQGFSAEERKALNRLLTKVADNLK
ncbi:MarR family winged helix-turn-helix transcriptional regulator [Gemmiger sp.]